MTPDPWLYGGSGDLFPEITWTCRPSMEGSEAPEALQDVWTATVMAIKWTTGSLRDGSCFLVNLVAAPLVEQALGEPVNRCAGYGAFIGSRRRIEFGFRWRPEKWANWIRADAGAHLSPTQDVHTWLETRSHIVDLSTGDDLGDVGHTWPPLIYWPKSRFPKHPREAKNAGDILLWRKAEAIEAVTEHLAPIVPPITIHAARILAENGACATNENPRGPERAGV